MISFFQSFTAFVQICFYILPGNEDFSSCQMIEKIPVSKVIFQSLRMSLLTSHFQSLYNKEETDYTCNLFCNIPICHRKLQFAFYGSFAFSEGVYADFLFNPLGRFSSKVALHFCSLFFLTKNLLSEPLIFSK